MIILTVLHKACFFKPLLPFLFVVSLELVHSLFLFRADAVFEQPPSHEPPRCLTSLHLPVMAVNTFIVQKFDNFYFLCLSFFN